MREVEKCAQQPSFINAFHRAFVAAPVLIGQPPENRVPSANEHMGRLLQAATGENYWMSMAGRPRQSVWAWMAADPVDTQKVTAPIVGITGLQNVCPTR